MKKIICVLGLFLISMPAWAGLKKVIAIGVVNASMLSFQGGNPGNLNSLLQDQIKKQIDASGRYVGVIVEEDQGLTEEDQICLDKLQARMGEGQTLSQQEMMQYSTLITKQMGPMMQQYAPPKNVAAQALMTFSASTGESSMDTGSVASTIGSVVNIPYGIGDMSSQSHKLTLTCVLHDPTTGQVIDQKKVDSTKTKFNRLGGMSTFSGTNQEEVYDKLFSKGVGKCVEWIDKKMESQLWEGKIFKVQGDKILLNAGSNAGVQPGMKFNLFGRYSVTGGGIHFGNEEENIGTVEAVTVKEGYSVLRPIGIKTISVGTIVRPVDRI
ncbi:MAG: hypothetical protein Q7T03_07525 [Deltaproteobacteria bacterium]|nr:hypothetical protein [Deltaproteobacteria bacterium]